MFTLTQIHIYPVKSLGGIALAESPVEARGLRHDRRWMVTQEDGTFLTQREHPRLALVSPRLTDDALELDAPEMETLRVPFAPPGTETRQVRVWRSVCDAVDMGEEAAQWFRRYLDTPCRLVSMPDRSRRAINPDYSQPGDIVSFADGYPLLLLGESSVVDLNARLAAPVPTDRFRPNLVVSGSPPYAEDGWVRIAVGGCVLRAAKRCDRCGLVTIDQATAARGQEPLRTLASYRTVDGKVLFGQYFIAEGVGVVRVGDPVNIPG